MTAGPFFRTGRALLWGALGLVIFAGCRRAAQPAARSVPAAATVNGVAIPVSRVQIELDRLRRGSVEGPAQPEAATSARLPRAVLDALIDRTLVLQRARAAGVQASEAEVQRATDALADSVRKGGDTFGQQLLRDDQTQERLAEETRERIVAEKYVAEETRREAPSKAEVRAYYDTHRSDFEQPEMAHAQGITVRSADEAKSLLDQLRKGASFDQLARTHGITPDARSGGDLGWFPRGVMPKEFEAVAFSLPAGKISGVLQTPYGFTVLKALGRRAGKLRSFNEAKAEAERRAWAEKRTEAERQLLAQLRQQAEIRVDDQALAQVK